ncbi:MAG: tetratricopeptide repeat protein [Planctomycetes bacterium]|nr:tetratricopeptide repeat protein [Planctomycetota bacterium]
MSILGKIRKIRNLRKLKAAAERSPSPQTVGALAEACIASGRLEEAHRLAKQGAAQFPASERLADVCRFVDRRRKSSEIISLREEIQQRPEPGLFRRLAEIHLDLGETDRALTLCEQCLEQFPLYEQAHLLIGQVRMSRFLQSRVAQDAVEAERQLRRVLKLDPRNERATVLLAFLCFVTGAHKQMDQTFQTTLIATPGLSDLADLAQAAASPRLWDRAVESRLEDELDEDERDSFVELARLVEMRGCFRNSPHMFPVDALGQAAAAAASWARLDSGLLKDSVRRLGNQPGVRNVTAIGEGGEPLSEHTGDRGLPHDDFALLTETIRSCADEATRRMDIGNFLWCTVEGAFGGLTVSQIREVTFGLMHGMPIRPERAHVMVEEAAAPSFVASREVGHA